MSSANPPDPPPSISAAELRRQLLASNPPAMGPATTGTLDVPTDTARSAQTGNSSVSTEEMLRKLRMPTGTTATPPTVQPDEHAVAAMAARASINRRSAPAGGRYGAETPPNYGMPGTDTPSAPEGPHPDVARLKSENKELRQLLDEMKHLLQEASESEQNFARSKKEFDTTNADKQQQIDELRSQLTQIEEQISSGNLGPAAGPPKTRTELEEWADELEQEHGKITQEKKRLAEDRTQLREDEESLEKQMRQMEVSMARERALMARQETELKRLSAEIQHELELMQRGDASLREQLSKFQRRAQDVLQKPGGNGSGTQGFPRR